jgi:hypothetical protein
MTRSPAIMIAIAGAGCQSSLDQRLAIVDSPRVLAVISSPAEARPGTQVAYTALLASPQGPLAVAPSWSLCTAPKPPTEDNAVSDPCIDDPSSLVAIDPAAAVVPADACALFGPDVPPGGFRPRDPDPTGGYYQPVRADVAGADLAFGFTRITCNLAAAPPDIAEEYKMMYVANVNPTLTVDAPAAVPAGSEVAITASWPAAAAESYLYFDPDRQVLVMRREAMRVSWYATSGALPVDASAVGETDPTTQLATTWRAPTTPGPAWLWVVLRDSRGGLATQIIAVTVQ